ncbi:unnamed protein product, partial [Ectocarpus fasciculatus]
RDEKGLRPVGDIARPLNESSERVHYFSLYGKIIFGAAPTIAFLIYYVEQFVAPRLRTVVDERLALIGQYELYWVYLGWYIVFLTRCYMAINANGARLPARVDRPDQHAYKIMSKSKPLADAPYVLMENAGPVGRFNRAQRAAAHMDEFIALFLTATILGACVFGPVSVLIALAYAYARVSFANSYTAHKQDRLKGIVLIVTTEHISAGLILFIAVKAAFFV